MEQNTIFGKRILVVEDEPAVRESIKLMLQIDRHFVSEAKDGMEALELVCQQPFDLVVLDFAMPGMLGGELAQHIRRLVPTLPILMVSAYVEKLNDSDKPVDAVLGKPFSVDRLRSAIAKLVPQ